jgi:hypothetical protein
MWFLYHWHQQESWEAWLAGGCKTHPKLEEGGCHEMQSVQWLDDL